MNFVKNVDPFRFNRLKDERYYIDRKIYLPCTYIVEKNVILISFIIRFEKLCEYMRRHAFIYKFMPVYIYTH